jgi:NADPH-dependent curcumin reductase CurA
VVESIGSIVVQFVRLKGLKAIGSTGSDKRVKWLGVGNRSCI